MDSRKRDVAILGATGAVGQRFVALLAEHPWFRITALLSSARSAHVPYRDAVRWVLTEAIPEAVAAMRVLPSEPGPVRADLVFSALDADAADSLEPLFRDSGFLVVSNARSFRGDPQVPLVVPEINTAHLELVRLQKEKYGGAIVTNPNCAAIGLCLSLEPLRQTFGVKRVSVTTMQALSGAGYPGVPSLDALGNVLTEIAGEEEKIESEPRKVFGALREGRVEPAELTVSAQCNRVPVREGHTLSVSVELAQACEARAVKEAFASFASPLARLGLPSAPARPVVLIEEFARPQPVRDADTSRAMAVSVGRVRPCPVLGYRYVAIVHNTVRGAAGGTILIAEYMVAEGLA